MTKDEALTLAIEVLLEMSPSGPTGSEIWHKQMSAITTASKALAQPEQEPKTCALLYPQADYVATLDERPWVGLTDEDKDEIIRVTESDHYHDILMLAEAKLKEKNT